MAFYFGFFELTLFLPGLNFAPAFHLSLSKKKNLQFAEAHNKVFMAVIDTMCDFIVIYKDDIPPNWLRDVLPSLLTKFGAALVPKTQEKILYALELVRSSFPVEVQLAHLFKMLLDPMQNLNFKVKLAVMEYLALILPAATLTDLEAVAAASVNDFRTVVGKIIDLANGTYTVSGGTQLQASMIMLPDLNAQHCLLPLRS